MERTNNARIYLITNQFCKVLFVAVVTKSVITLSVTTGIPEITKINQQDSNAEK